MNRQVRDTQIPLRPLAGAGLLLLLAALPAQAVDWSQVPERELTLFYPGQASWEWALTERDHSGGPKFREGRSCRSCHEGEERDIGAAIVGGGALEPAPIPGKAGSLTLRVKAAHDGERLYFRLRWQPGPPLAKKLDPDVASRVTVMLDDGSVREAGRAGCWGSCHDDAMGMASAPEGGRIQKYLGASRVRLTRQGGGENLKPEAELEQLIGQGVFLEYWQAKLNPGQAAQAVGAHILERRHKDPQTPVRAEANFADGEWTVLLSRPLKAMARGQKTLAPGKTYMVAFAVHDGHADHRYHYVSFEHSLTLDGGSADFVAGKR